MTLTEYVPTEQQLNGNESDKDYYAQSQLGISSIARFLPSHIKYGTMKSHLQIA